LQTQQKLVQEKDDLISNISHELKTPIATVSVALEAIAQFDNTRPDKQKEYLGMARQELTRLTSLTEKILLTSFAENQQIKIQYKPVVLQDVVQQTLQSYKLVFEKHEAHIIVNISETPLTVTGNAEFLTQALHNILDNALKYKKEKPTITIEVLQEHNMAIIRIHDNGIGIAPEYQLKIFDKFYRVPSGDVHNHKGYGLGLNFVKQVVTMHKGNIQVQSTLHAGSTFSIYLPLQHE
jgi:two-component system phosphate regulon sensor histidine kinase PhoR